MTRCSALTWNATNFTASGTTSSNQTQRQLDTFIYLQCLRTGHESRPSSGSSHSSAPRRCDTELLYGAIHGSTVSKIGYPRRVTPSSRIRGVEGSQVLD